MEDDHIYEPSVPEEEEEEEDVHVGSEKAVGSDASNELVEYDEINRRKLIPLGYTFKNNHNEVLKVISKNIHSHFKGPWVSLKKVPKSGLKLWWEEFEKVYFWDASDGPVIKRNWRLKCSQHMRNAFSAAREANRRPDWIRPDYWIEMMKYFDKNEEFLKSRETNKRNRASMARNGAAVYTGGSKPVVQYEEEFFSKNGRNMTPEELMYATYYSKKDKQWKGDRAPKGLDRLKELKSDWLKTHDKITPEDEMMLWDEAVGGEHKGHIFGRGSSYVKWDFALNPPVGDTTLQPHNSTKQPRKPSPQPRDQTTQPHDQTTQLRSLTPLVRSPHLHDYYPSPPDHYPPEPARDASLSALVAPQVVQNLTQSQMFEYMMRMDARFEAQKQENEALVLRQKKENEALLKRLEMMENQRSPGLIAPEVSLSALMTSISGVPSSSLGNP